MGSFLTLAGQGYATEALLFALTVVLLSGPLAFLMGASFFEGLMRRQGGRGGLAPAPLALRRSNRVQLREVTPP